MGDTCAGGGKPLATWQFSAHTMELTPQSTYTV
jgi:hypothetical protein